MTLCTTRITRDQRCGRELRLVEWAPGLTAYGHADGRGGHYPRPAEQPAERKPPEPKR